MTLLGGRMKPTLFVGSPKRFLFLWSAHTNAEGVRLETQAQIIEASFRVASLSPLTAPKSKSLEGGKGGAPGNLN